MLQICVLRNIRQCATTFWFSSLPSSSTVRPETEDDEHKKVTKKSEPKVLTKFLPKAQELLYSGKTHVPTSLGFTNPRGMDNFDPDKPVEEWMRNAKDYVIDNTKKFMQEPYRYKTTLEKPDLYKLVRGSIHNETVIYYDFKSEDSLKVWKTGCDSDWREGYSKCDLYLSDKNTAIFEGSLSSKLVKDGRTKRAGYCGMKTFDRLSFQRKKFIDMRFYTHLLIKCRGDGRSYKVMLYSPEFADISWGDSHSYPLYTHGGPYWQFVRIPLSRFFHTVAGRIQDRQYSVKKSRVSSIGIILMDRVEGDFRLEIDYIGVTNDVSHREQFAYETYQLPVINTTGF